MLKFRCQHSHKEQIITATTHIHINTHTCSGKHPRMIYVWGVLSWRQRSKSWKSIPVHQIRWRFLPLLAPVRWWLLIFSPLFISGLMFSHHYLSPFCENHKSKIGSASYIQCWCKVSGHISILLSFIYFCIIKHQDIFLVGDIYIFFFNEIKCQHFSSRKDLKTEKDTVAWYCSLMLQGR